MKTLKIFGLIALACICFTLSGQNSVISSNPQNGATNVDVNTRYIEIELQHAAEPYDIELFPLESLPMPFFIDYKEMGPSKVLHLEIEYLEPNTKYGVEFVSYDEYEYQFTPFKLVFTTGGGQMQGNFRNQDYPVPNEERYDNDQTEVLQQNVKTQNKPAPVSSTSGSAITSPKAKTLKFQRVWEKNERAASILMPEGWIMEGGLVRIPVSQYMTMSTFDVTIKNNNQGEVMVDWYPDGVYISGGSGGQMYGLPVKQALNPEQYLLNEIIKKNSQEIKIVNKEKIKPEIMNKYLAQAQQMNAKLDGIILTVEYNENGKLYREKLRTILFYLPPMMNTTWGSMENFSVRAPAESFDEWFAVYEIMANSVKVNPQWQAMEQQRVQQQTAYQNQQLMNNTQWTNNFVQQQQQITNTVTQVVASGQQQQNELNNINSQFCNNLSGLQECVNPHTGESEITTNNYDYRWVDPVGNEIYTNDPNLNPDVDMNLNGYELSKPK